MIDALIMGLGVPALLTIVIIALLVQQHRTQVNHNRDQQELVNKIMAKDYKDYAEGTHRIDMGIAAIEAAARTPKPKLKPERDEDLSENLDEVPIT